MALNDQLPVNQYTSARIATTYEAFMNKPQYVPQLRQSIGEGIYMFDVVGALKGNERYVASETWKAHESLPKFRTMTIGDTVAGGGSAGALITFNLATTDVGSSPDYYYYPRVGQSFIAGSAQEPHEMVIMSVTATNGADGATITAYNKDSTTNTAWHPDAYIKAGMTFALSPAVNAAEGTAGTTSTHVGYQEFTYYTQVLKDMVGFENAEFARENWYNIHGGMIYSDEIARMDLNLDAAMEMATWVGQKTTNTSIVQTSLATGGNATVYGTQGIWDWIRERGYDLDFTYTTDFTFEHLYELSEYAETVGLGSGEWMLSYGGDLMRRLEKNCKSYITNATGSLNEQFTPDAGGGYKDLNIGFKSVMLGQQKIYLHNNSIFNNPYLLGISDYGFKDAGCAFPLGNVRDGKTGALIPNISYVYRGLGPYKNRKRAFATFVGTGGPNYGPVTLEGDISKIHATVDFGLEALEMWRGVRIFNTDIVNNS